MLQGAWVERGRCICFKLYIQHVFLNNLLFNIVRSRAASPVLKWSLPDNSHVCLVTDSTTNRDHFSNHFSRRDIAVSNLTAMIARDEYVLEESYSGEEEDEGKEVGEDEKGSDSETDSEIGRLRERKEELERARQKEQARARKAKSEILSEVVSVSLHITIR